MKKHITYDLDTCMDIFDWFGADEFDFLTHIWLTKLDGEQRLQRALPAIRQKAKRLVQAHRGCEDAYPEFRYVTLSNKPA